MRFLLLLLFFVFSQYAEATVKVAVVDTGFNFKLSNKVKLCPGQLHKDFSDSGTVDDVNGHGTNVVGLISKNLKNVDYCIIIVKFYHKSYASIPQLLRALHYTTLLKPDYVNLSLGGFSYSYGEHVLISTLLNQGSKVVVAAGNEAMNLDLFCGWYPACYDQRLFVIGNKYNHTANHGKIVDKYIDGNKKTGLGVTMSGSSQSAAIYTNQLLRSLGE